MLLFIGKFFWILLCPRNSELCLSWVSVNNYCLRCTSVVGSRLHHWTEILRLELARFELQQALLSASNKGLNYIKKCNFSKVMIFQKTLILTLAVILFTLTHIYYCTFFSFWSTVQRSWPKSFRPIRGQWCYDKRKTGLWLVSPIL